MVRLNVHNVAIIILVAAIGMKLLLWARRTGAANVPVLGSAIAFLAPAAA